MLSESCHIRTAINILSACELSTDEELLAEEEDLDASSFKDLAGKYLGEGEGEENDLKEHVTPGTAVPEPKEEEQPPNDEIREPAEPV